MAYADQKTSGNRVIALVIVALLHVLLGYGLVTGLAFEAVKKVAQRVTTIDIKEEPEPEPQLPPPPPPKEAPPPPVVAPPPPINIAPAPPVIQTAPVAPVIQPKPVVTAPPPPKFTPKPPQPRNNPGSWATPDDYPTRAMRENRAGVARFTVTVGADGKVQSCQVTSSSGHADLDEATCKYVTRRARFKPATDGEGNPTTGTYSNAVRWQIPD